MTDSAIDPSLVQPGMRVLSSDGEHVGEVQSVRDDRVLVGRQAPMSAVAVPWPFVQYVAGDQVVLTIAAGRVDQMGWAGS